MKILLVAAACILTFYLFAIHPFEVPDEQSHLAQIHFFVTEKRMPTMWDEKNLSTEEMLVERVFGTMSLGENKYSRHPEYRIEYVSNSYVGKYEEYIKSLNTQELRSTYTIDQSSLYPPLYYWFGALFYRLVENADLLLRLYTTRLASLLISLWLPAVAYLVAQLIWPKNKTPTIVASLVLFFPMFSYLGVGINSDNLHNLLYGLALFLFLKLIKNGWNNRLSLAIGLVIGLDILTKPQGLILLPTLATAILLRGHFREWKLWLRHLLLIAFAILVIAGWQEIPKFLYGNYNVGATSYLARTISYGGWDNFAVFLRGYLATHLKEIPVWYWGIFKWFGVLLPKAWWWVANRVVGLALIGMFLKLWRDYRQHKFSFTSRFILLTAISHLLYAAALFWFDWQFYQEYGRSIGFQARYYYPFLITQIIVLVIGLTEFAWNEKARLWILRGLFLFFLGLQLTSLYTQLSVYYDLTPFSVLLEQISQYRPGFAKANWWYLWFSLYLAGIITTCTLALSSSFPLTTKKKLSPKRYKG